jgi:hypothetical protein
VKLLSAIYHSPHPFWCEKAGTSPSPKSSPDGLTLNDSTNDPETNFGNIRKTSSERPTTTHTLQQIKPVRTSTPKHDPFQKIPFAKSFTNRRWPSDLLRWPLALLLPSTHRNNNIALQRILNHLSHFASHPQTLKILAQKILMEWFLGLNYNYLKPTNKSKYNSLHSCVSLSFFGQRFLIFGEQSQNDLVAFMMGLLG